MKPTKPFCHDCAHFGAKWSAGVCRAKQPHRWLAPTDSLDPAYGHQPTRTINNPCFTPMPITQEQLDRGLTIAENVVGLAADIWQTRKNRKGRKPVARKAATKRLAKAKKANP